MGWLSALLGRDRGSERTLHRLLRQRGANRGLRRFAEPFGADAERFWDALPRGTWALCTAARLGVNRALVATAMAALAEQARTRRANEPDPTEGVEPLGLLSEPAFTRPGVSEALLDQTTTLGRVFATRGVPIDRFATESTSLLLAVIDADPSVRAVQARVEEAQRWGRLEEVLHGKHAHDAVHAERHLAMAQLVRRHIGAHDLTAAIRGAAAHPYR